MLLKHSNQYLKIKITQYILIMIISTKLQIKYISKRTSGKEDNILEAVVPFLALTLSIYNGIVPAKIYHNGNIPVSILRKSISGRHRPVRVADGPMTARCRFT